MRRLQVRHFAVPSYVIDFSGFAGFENLQDGPAVVPHIEPVAYLLSVAVDGNGVPLKRFLNHQGNQLFGKLVGPVVIGAIGGQRWKTVSPMIGPYQMVR